MKESIKSGDRYIPCILSRLADDEPQSRIDSMPRVVPLEKIKQEILLNINQILNSRSRPSPRDMGYLPEVGSSVLCFGLSDFCGLTKSIESVEKIKNEIISQIRYFEPRVDAESVIVEYQDDSFDKSSGFVFEICAQFSLKALSGKFICISYLDLETGMATVRIKE
jgi:type VI secretion system protein ImpF